MFRRTAFFLIFLALCAATFAQEKKRFVLYAMFIEEAPVQLADGARWRMDKGDTFPLLMFKEQHTKAILQLAGTTFMAETKALKVVEEKDLTEEQLATYRLNVANYIEAQSAKWKEQAK